MTQLGADWIPDQNGTPRREASRAVIFSPDLRVLLLHGHDGHDPAHEWWFTVGGGIARGETPEECVLREIREETGLKVYPDALIGPVLYREADFRFRNVRARQDEWFFLVFLKDHSELIDLTHLTESEQDLVDEYRWVTVTEMKKIALTEQIFPHNLPELCETWKLGWDGICLSMRERS